MVYSFNNTFINSLFRYMFFFKQLALSSKNVIVRRFWIFQNVQFHKYGLLTKHEFKMARHQPSFFGVCVLWTKTKTKKRARLISSYPEQTSLFFKGFSMLQKDITLIRIKNNFVSLLHALFFCATLKQAILSWQDGPILPAQAANQNTGFASYCLWVLLAIY